MTKEEEFVVGMLEHCQNTYIEDTLVTCLQLTTEKAKILLNLIKKQQKEIEELKNDLKEERNFNKSALETLKECVHKDKIKEKIKKLETERDNIPKERDYRSFYSVTEERGIEIAVLHELLGE